MPHNAQSHTTQPDIWFNRFNSQFYLLRRTYDIFTYIYIVVHIALLGTIFAQNFERVMCGA